MARMLNRLQRIVVMLAHVGVVGLLAWALLDARARIEARDREGKGATAAVDDVAAADSLVEPREAPLADAALGDIRALPKPHFDSELRLTANETPVIPGPTTEVRLLDYIEQTETDASFTYRWRPEPRRGVLLRNMTVALQFTDGVPELLMSPANLSVLVDGQAAGQPTITTASTRKIDSVNLGSLSPGQHALTVKANVASGNIQAGEEIARVVVHVEETTLPTPTILGVRNNAYAAPNEFIEQFGSGHAVGVYGGYLLARGTFPTPTGFNRVANFETYVVEPGNPKRLIRIEDAVANFTTQADGTWTTEIALPASLQKTTAVILAPVTSSGDVAGRSYRGADPASYIYLTVVSQANVEPAPTISKVKTDDMTGANDNALAGSPTLAYVKKSTVELGVGARFVSGAPTDSRILVFERLRTAISPVPLAIYSPPNATTPYSITLSNLTDGPHVLYAVIAQGNQLSTPSAEVAVHVMTGGPRIIAFSPENRMFAPGRIEATVFFDQNHPLDPVKAENEEFFQFKNAAVRNAEFLPAENAVRLSINDPDEDGVYQITVRNGLTDRAGVALAADKSLHQIPVSVALDTSVDAKPAVGMSIEVTVSKLFGVTANQVGVMATNSPPVEFTEYTKPRFVPEGFNPSDHVETRVARLYYYRDAHRVAQIINRKTRSYNRQAVDMAQQRADHARGVADDATTERRVSEQQAVVAAQKARQAEQRLGDLQTAMTQAANDEAFQRRSIDQMKQERGVLAAPDVAEANKAKIDALDQRIVDATTRADAARSVLTSLDSQVTAAQVNVEALRKEEVQANETLLRKNESERRAREDQFRRETAAAHADPDTYAPGDPESMDPVAQVSVSVIGEGVIQLRGPLKGINIIRRMINEIDAPVGQVRVAIHTMQVNGEHGDRMEKVVGEIQMSVDQARFLTLESAEMLRKSIAWVASQRASEARMAAGVETTQEQRDVMYLYAFFGADFVRELQAMDSEFLHTGNKVLSLHSMDSTSLANALFIMSLAKNSTRRQIMETFYSMLQCELPRAEQSYIESSFSCPPKQDFEYWLCGEHKKGHCLLAQNARFETLRGFFNGEIMGDDTITPVQREFIRLAQIFKSRLITERELNQRVVERAIIEERIGSDYVQALKDAKEREKQANLDAELARKDRRTQLVAARAIFQAFMHDCDVAIADLVEKTASAQDVRKAYETRKGDYYGKGALEVDEQLQRDLNKIFEAVNLYRFELLRAHYFTLRNFVRRNEGYDVPSHEDALTATDRLLAGMQTVVGELKEQIHEIDLMIGNPDYGDDQVFRKWTKLAKDLDQLIWRTSAANKGMTGVYRERIAEVNVAFRAMLEAGLRVEAAVNEAQLARRPLDHKKFLDMLVDDLEDKYIELLEGTRAHTANVDNYIKRLATALEDDFNTQFYFPTFRMSREASRYWDVTFAQLETTSILTNNRELGKVSPQATMEFDLPKRDILVTEALKGAKAAVDEYGALLNDPTFLSVAKMGSGMPTSSQLGGASAGFSNVRNVLPGLPSSTQEQILSQTGPGDTQIGSAFESLIPDPAIYKFETGTGYEIRPVIQPDGQAVVFHFNYLYTTQVREPVRADEKHLGRVKQHYIDTDVQLSNYELREVSRYQVALKASRTARGVPLLEDVPLLGVLFRPLPQQESSLQQNVILGQTVIYPTLFDLMGLRWAPAVADLDPLRLSNEEFIVRGRRQALQNRVYDHASSQVDDFLQIPEAMRRQDLYRSQESIPSQHPNGYEGTGLDRSTGTLQEGYQGERGAPSTQFYPSERPDGSLHPRDWPPMWQYQPQDGSEFDSGMGPMQSPGEPMIHDGSWPSSRIQSGAGRTIGLPYGTEELPTGMPMPESLPAPTAIQGPISYFDVEPQLPPEAPEFPASE